jgi:signal peptidase II
MNKFISKISIKDIAIAMVIAIFFIADRWLKIIALEFAEKEPIRLIKGLFSFNFTENYYIAFSLPLTGPILNISVLLIIIALISYIIHLIWLKKDKLLIYLLTFILFGAISNILDRFLYGYVIDYLELKYFTVFNIADIMISGGAIITILCYSKKKTSK